jgi:hypothetical protein
MVLPCVSNESVKIDPFSLGISAYFGSIFTDQSVGGVVVGVGADVG